MSNEEVLTLNCPYCSDWFDPKKIKCELLEEDDEIPTGHNCPNGCDTLLHDTSEYEIQTPWQKEQCDLFKGQIWSYQEKIDELNERIKEYIGEPVE